MTRQPVSKALSLTFGVALAAAATFTATFSGVAAAKGRTKPVAPATAGKADKPAGAIDISFITKAADAARAKRDYRREISLRRGALAALGDADAAAVWKLEEAWELAGQPKGAARALEAYAAITQNADEITKAKTKIQELMGREGFETHGEKFEPDPAPEAAEAFKRGLAAYKKKDYALAIAYFKAGSFMAPDLPGNYRELGASFQALGQTREAEAFYIRYLFLRPFSKQGTDMIKYLGTVGKIGKVSFASSLPCETVFLNGEPLPKTRKLPVKDQPMVAGDYEMLCYSEKYHLGQFEKFTVTAGQHTAASFDFALIDVQQLKPWARVVIEDPADPAKMNDIGTWQVIGVPIPKDRRKLKVRLTAGEDPTHIQEDLVTLEPGKTVVLKWHAAATR